MVGTGVVASDTLVGIATGSPDGGVAIVRLSGPRARAIAEAQVGALPAPRVLGLRNLAGEAILVVWMPGPRSFTGEDVVELHIHAGTCNVASVLELMLAAGASAAGPGDFSRRAFEHGRLSLDQVEGIAALIGARTQAALAQAKRLVAGELGREVEVVRAALEQLRIEVEANLDFPEDVAAADELRWADECQHLQAELERWLARYEAGRRARAKPRVVLAGPPNAGKSALFNALLGRRRALVSAQPGTTRDFVEAELTIAGRELTVIDTAGLRPSDDILERAGVELGREQLAGADLVLWIEGSDQPTRPDWQREREAIADTEVPTIAVENKADLGRQRPTWLGVSAIDPATLEPLRAAISGALGEPGEGWIGLARHRDRAHEAKLALAEAREQLQASAGLELVAFALAQAQQRVGEITGHTGLGPIGATMLDAIFSRFCIGK
ncbi:MAG: tRNA modification GTPase [Nannocystis sp.]|uniref:tRNA modification GTPase n=1 Tax=Nannocystis sp. TaxID=1962667 RepID=UPI00242521DC|nr:tRNA modification GTPase [Nannocystis sp.]MBK9754563.1 tRNA modification GTPase [Nannocystis sp.]